MKSDILADVKEYYRSRISFNLVIAMFIAVLLFFVLCFTDDNKKGSLIILSILGGGYFIWTVVTSLVHYIKLVKSIKERWPAETEQMKLVHDFRESVSVWLERMRIGKNYTFIASETGFWIIDTQKIVDFSMEPKEGNTRTAAVYVDLESEAQTKRLHVETITDAVAMEHIQEAKSVLRKMNGEQGEGLNNNV